MSTQPQLALQAPAPFETPRILLRKPKLEDAASLFERYTQDAAVCRYMTWLPHTELERTEDFVERCLSVWEEGSAFPWILEARDDGRILGMVEARVDGAHSLCLGYVLARPEWGKGLMSEAMRPVLEWALAQPSVFRVWAVCDFENTRSARVMQKAGMQREGRLRRFLVHPNLSNEPRDCECYSKVR